MSNSTKKPVIMLDFLAYGRKDGGFTSSIHMLCQTCQSLSEFDFIVLCSRDHAVDFSNYGFRVIGVPLPRKVRYFASLFVVPIAAALFRPDLIHFEISARTSTLGAASSATVHDLYFMDDPSLHKDTFGGRLTDLYWRRIYLPRLRKVDGIRAISQTTIDDLKKYLPEVDVPALIYPRVNSATERWNFRNLPSGDDPIRLVFVGSIIPRKNLKYLLNALQHVSRNWHLDIIGNIWWGAEDIAPFQYDKRIKVWGFVEDTLRDDLLDQAHFLVSPSIYEGFGLPIAEAMAVSLPVLVSDIPVYREIAPSASLFSLDSPLELGRIIDNLSDERYASFQLAGRSAVARFSPEIQVSRFREFFSGLTRRKQ